MPYLYGMFEESLPPVDGATFCKRARKDRLPRRYTDSERVRNLNIVTALTTVTLLVVIAAAVIGEWSLAATFQLLGVVFGYSGLLWWLFASPGATKETWG